MRWWTALVNAMHPTPARRAPQISAWEVEQLLHGAPVAPEHHALAELIAAASAPGTPEELAGKDAAVASFRSLRRAVPAERHPGARRRLTVTLATVSSARLAAGAAVLLLGVTALVAEMGQLPDPAQRSAHRFLSAVGVPPPDGRSTSPTPSPSASSPSAPAPRPSAAATSPAAPATVMALCTTYLSTKKPGKDLSQAQLDQLAAAAGGADLVEGYCTRMLAVTSPTPAPAATPSTELSPTGKVKATCHGNGKKACPTETN